jgi:hypothetical protein
LNSDLKKINNEFGNILVQFNLYINKKSFNKTLEQKNTMMFVLADYLFATALDELGCPDIPPFFGDEGKKSFADHMKVMSTVTNREDYEAVSTDTQFKLQRKKSAEKVRTATTEYFNRSSYNPLQPLDGAKFTAEYQTLKKRQNNHGPIWRFFHGKENEKRMELLAAMKAELEKYIDTDTMDIDSVSPNEVAEYMDRKKVDKMLEKEFDKDGFAKRNSFGPQAFEHEPTTEKRYNDEIKDIEKANMLNIKDDVNIFDNNIEVTGEIDANQNQKDNIKNLTV